MYLKIPIGLAFRTSNRSNARTKVKVIKNKTMDELIDSEFDIPGVKDKELIFKIVQGARLCQDLQNKYN